MGATLFVLVLAAAVTFMRGNAPVVSVVLGFSAFLVAPFRRCYYRHARLLSEPLSFTTILSLILLIGCALLIGTHREATDSWWQLFVPDGSHARWIVTVAGALALLVIASLARPGRVIVRSWNEKDADWYYSLDHAIAAVPVAVVRHGGRGSRDSGYSVSQTRQFRDRTG